MKAHNPLLALLGFPIGLSPRARPRVVAQPGTVAVPASADEAIRNALLQRLAQEAWWDADRNNVFVDRGTVVYQGLIGRSRSRHAAHEIAMQQTGVRAVWDARVPRREWQGMV